MTRLQKINRSDNRKQSDKKSSSFQQPGNMTRTAKKTTETTVKRNQFFYSNFDKEVEEAFMIAESLTMKVNKAVEFFMALIGGMYSSVDVLTTFQAAWHNSDPTKQELWQESIQK